MTAANVIKDLEALANPNDATFLQRFFKTGEGEYGEGDMFLGIRVPVVRKVAKAHPLLHLTEIEKLLESPVHEHRLCGVIIMVERTKQASEEEKRALYELYLRRTDRLNNWDIIDASCRDVVGGYLMDKPRKPLYNLAQSADLWERRIAIVSTWQFIRVGDLEDTFRIAELLLDDQQDLIHKASGWMLREAGKKNEVALKEFLDKHAAIMPRTMLRYALEKLHPSDRLHYMGARARTQ